MHLPPPRVGSPGGEGALCVLTGVPFLGQLDLGVRFGEQPMRKSGSENRDIWLILPTARAALNDLQQEQAPNHARSALPGRTAQPVGRTGGMCLTNPGPHVTGSWQSGGRGTRLEKVKGVCWGGGEIHSGQRRHMGTSGGIYQKLFIAVTSAGSC